MDVRPPGDGMMMTRSRARREAAKKRVGVTTRSMARREAALAAEAKIKKRTPRSPIERRWPRLLPDLLETISDRLPIRDLVAFRSVCRGWHSAPCGRSSIFKFSKKTPWFIIYDTTTAATTTNRNSQDPKCFLYHPTVPESCTLRLHSLHGATCLVSKFGWLLAHRDGRLFLCNPFSLTTIDLPPYPRFDPARQVYTFASLPTSPYCTVFILSSKNSAAIEVGSCCLGDDKWSTHDVTINDPQFGAVTELQCCNCYDDEKCSCAYQRSSGLFCFDDKGNCLVYNPLGNGVPRVVPSAEARYTTLFAELAEVHQTEWLRRFGGKGVMLSTCGLSMKLDGAPGIRRCRYGIGVGGAGVSRVSGALIEPRF